MRLRASRPRSNHACQPHDRLSDHQGKSRDKRTDSRGSRQPAEGSRAAMEHLGGEDRQQYAVGVAHQADKRKEQKDGANGTKSTGM